MFIALGDQVINLDHIVRISRHAQTGEVRLETNIKTLSWTASEADYAALCDSLGVMKPGMRKARAFFFPPTPAVEEAVAHQPPTPPPAPRKTRGQK